MSARKLSEHRKSKIRFSQDVSLEEHFVDCVTDSNGLREVHVGLLSIFHNYEIKFHVNHCLGDNVQIPPLQTPTIEVVELKATEGGHDVIVNLKCNVEGKFNEEIVFDNPDGETMTLQFVGIIMGETQGTPALKSGVRLVSKNIDMLSNAATEWPGFQDEDGT